MSNTTAFESFLCNQNLVWNSVHVLTPQAGYQWETAVICSREPSKPIDPQIIPIDISDSLTFNTRNLNESDPFQLGSTVKFFPIVGVACPNRTLWKYRIPYLVTPKVHRPFRLRLFIVFFLAVVSCDITPVRVKIMSLFASVQAMFACFLFPWNEVTMMTKTGRDCCKR